MYLFVCLCVCVHHLHIVHVLFVIHNNYVFILCSRLGGIPVGVIAVETRSVDVSIPADPANTDSEAKVYTCRIYSSIAMCCCVGCAGVITGWPSVVS